MSSQNLSQPVESEKYYRRPENLETLPLQDRQKPRQKPRLLGHEGQLRRRSNFTAILDMFIKTAIGHYKTNYLILFRMARKIENVKVPMSLMHKSFTGTGYRAFKQALDLLKEAIERWGHDISRPLLLALTRTMQEALPNDLRLSLGLEGVNQEVLQKTRLRVLLERNYELTLGDLLFSLRAMLREIPRELKNPGPTQIPNDSLELAIEQTVNAIG